MKNLCEELFDFSDDIVEKYPDVSRETSLTIAAEIQRTRMLRDAMMADGDHPSVFEAIALALGHTPGPYGGSTIPSSINDLADAIRGLEL